MSFYSCQFLNYCNFVIIWNFSNLKQNLSNQIINILFYKWITFFLSVLKITAIFLNAKFSSSAKIDKISFLKSISVRLALQVRLSNFFYLTRLLMEERNCTWNVLSKYWCVWKLNFSTIYFAHIFLYCKRFILQLLKSFYRLSKFQKIQRNSCLKIDRIWRTPYI